EPDGPARRAGLGGGGHAQVLKRAGKIAASYSEFSQIQVDAQVVRILAQGEQEFLLRLIDLFQIPVSSSQRIVYAGSVRTLGQGSAILLERIFVSLVVGVDLSYQCMQLEGIRVELRKPLDGCQRGVHIETHQLIELVGILGITEHRLVELR